MLRELEALQRQEKHEKAKFAEQMRVLRGESERYERTSARVIAELEEAEEDEKIQTYIKGKGARLEQEQRVVRHGYLQAQRAKIAAAYADVCAHVGAEADASPGEITELFATLEGTVRRPAAPPPPASRRTSP